MVVKINDLDVSARNIVIDIIKAVCLDKIGFIPNDREKIVEVIDDEVNKQVQLKLSEYYADFGCDVNFELPAEDVANLLLGR